MQLPKLTKPRLLDAAAHHRRDRLGVAVGQERQSATPFDFKQVA